MISVAPLSAGVSVTVMGVHCAAVGCNNYQSQCHLSFFRFPKDPKRLVLLQRIITPFREYLCCKCHRCDAPVRSPDDRLGPIQLRERGLDVLVVILLFSVCLFAKETLCLPFLAAAFHARIMWADRPFRGAAVDGKKRICGSTDVRSGLGLR